MPGPLLCPTITRSRACPVGSPNLVDQAQLECLVAREPPVLAFRAPQVPSDREVRAAPEYREALQDLTRGALLSDDEEDEYSIPNWIMRTRTDEENQDIPGIEDWVPSWRDLRRYFVEEFDMDEFTADRFVRDYGADIEVALRQLGFGVYDEEEF